MVPEKNERVGTKANVKEAKNGVRERERITKTKDSKLSRIRPELIRKRTRMNLILLMMKTSPKAIEVGSSETLVVTEAETEEIGEEEILLEVEEEEDLSLKETVKALSIEEEAVTEVETEEIEVALAPSDLKAKPSEEPELKEAETEVIAVASEIKTKTD
jgi:hypothetical protein